MVNWPNPVEFADGMASPVDVLTQGVAVAYDPVVCPNTEAGPNGLLLMAGWPNAAAPVVEFRANTVAAVDVPKGVAPLGAKEFGLLKLVFAPKPG